MTHLLYSGENLAKMFLLNFQAIHINFGTNDEKRQKNKFQGVCANVNRFKFKFEVKFWVSKPKVQNCVNMEV